MLAVQVRDQVRLAGPGRLRPALPADFTFVRRGRDGVVVLGNQGFVGLVHFEM